MAISSLHLDAFLAVVKSQSFSKAAKELHVTQSALSQRILNLEEELGTTLLIRDRGGVRLTQVGSELLRYAKTKDALETEFLTRLKSKKKGVLAGALRIAGYSSVMRSVVLPSVAELVRAHPEVRVELMTRELHELPSLLKRGEADFILLDREIEPSRVEAVRLGDEKYVLIEAKGMDKIPEIFLDHDERDQTTEKFFARQRKKFAKMDRSFLDDIYGLLDGVRLGLGRAVVPQHLVRLQKDLRVLPGYAAEEIPVFLHFQQQPYYSELHQAVLSALMKNAPKYL
jgi:DNA-binding transcriptional LysR family regulator